MKKELKNVILIGDEYNNEGQRRMLGSNEFCVTVDGKQYVSQINQEEYDVLTSVINNLKPRLSGSNAKIVNSIISGLTKGENVGVLSQSFEKSKEIIKELKKYINYDEDRFFNDECKIKVGKGYICAFKNINPSRLFLYDFKAILIAEDDTSPNIYMNSFFKEICEDTYRSEEINFKHLTFK